MDNHPVKQAIDVLYATTDMVVAGTGAWLLYYGARSGEVSWPWAEIAYLT